MQSKVLCIGDEYQGVLRREHRQGILWHPDAIGTGLRKKIEAWSIIIVKGAGYARALPAKKLKIIRDRLIIIITFAIKEN